MFTNFFSTATLIAALVAAIVSSIDIKLQYQEIKEIQESQKDIIQQQYQLLQKNKESIDELNATKKQIMKIENRLDILPTNQTSKPPAKPSK